MYGSRALSFIGGPSVGGLLVQLLTAPFAVAADALSFLGSALFLGRIRPAEPPAAAGRAGSLTAGARFILGSGIVRASLPSVATINFFNFMFFALFVLYATRALHIRPGLLGLILGAGAIGGLMGSPSPGGSRPGWGWLGLLRRLRAVPGAARARAAGRRPAPLVLAMLFAAEFVSGFGVMILDISIGSIFAAVIPDQLRSRVSGAFSAVNYGTRPAGALLGGASAPIGMRPRCGSRRSAGQSGSCGCCRRRCPGSGCRPGAELA